MKTLSADVLAHLAGELREILSGAELIDAFSTGKKEAFFHFYSGKGRWFNIRFLQDAETCFLSFPSHIHREIRNRLDLFPAIHQQKVETVLCHPGERSFELQFASGNRLLFKMHGRNANLLLSAATEISLFRKEFLNDSEWIQTVSATYCPPPTPHKWFIAQNSDGYLLTPQTDEFLSDYEHLHEALTDFSALYLKSYSFEKQKSLQEQELKSRIRQTEKHIQQLTERKAHLKSPEYYQHQGDLLQSYLYLIQGAEKEIEVFDWQRNAQVKVKLNPDLSPAENMARYYRKAKNAPVEADYLDKQIAGFQEKLKRMTEQFLQLSVARGTKDLKQSDRLLKKETSRKEKQAYREFVFQDYHIWVGKSSKDNDELTLHLARKDDLWLHARDVSGSHVIVRRQAGKPVPETVLEYAAGIAAWYSKRRNETLCPVSCTEKKYVRKRKGMADGQVVIEKDKVILVKPLDPEKPAEN